VSVDASLQICCLSPYACGGQTGRGVCYSGFLRLAGVFEAVAVVGPILVSLLSNDPNERPAIWRLFSIGIVLVSLSPLIRGKLLGSATRGLT